MGGTCDEQKEEPKAGATHALLQAQEFGLPEPAPVVAQYRQIEAGGHGSAVAVAAIPAQVSAAQQIGVDVQQPDETTLCVVDAEFAFELRDRRLGAKPNRTGTGIRASQQLQS